MASSCRQALKRQALTKCGVAAGREAALKPLTVSLMAAQRRQRSTASRGSAA